jgi:hypothetical protein
VIQGEGSEANGVTEGWFTFETATGRGRGHLRLIGGRAWTLLTTLQELKGFEEKKRDKRPKGVDHGAYRDRKSWLEARQDEERTLGFAEQPYVVVIGGGQAGIILGARLKKLDVPAIVVEKNPKPGDSWRNRYKSLCLHDPVWYDHLPYLPFPDDWPVFSPKDKIGDWLESYAKLMELNYWGGTECMAARWDDSQQQWQVTVQHKGESVTLKPKHQVCNRHGARPTWPTSRHERLQGQAGASSQYESGEDRGKRAWWLSGFGVHDTSRPVGNRRRRDDGAALDHARGPQRLADGSRARRPVLGISRQGGHRHGHGGFDLRVAAVQGAAAAAGAGVPADEGARCRVLLAAREGGLPARLRR